MAQIGTTYPLLILLILTSALCNLHQTNILGIEGLKNTSWEKIASWKRQEINGRIPKEWLLPQSTLDEARQRRQITGDFIEGLLDMETRLITGMESDLLLAQIRQGSLKASQVARAFCKRTAFAHQLNNNLLEILFDGALAKADELDHYAAKHNATVGPLHGLPVTLKDQFHVKGGNTTMAYVGWVGTLGGRSITEEGDVESELVKELHQLGAVVIGKTSCVQTLWYAETNNNIIGYTMNPVNQNLSCGGSSGGEGALLALRGTTLGFGTDIGGSVSIPAAFNGVYSIKPSHGRISYKNAANSSPGQVVLPSVVGIMGESVSSLKLMLRSLLSTEPWRNDPEIVQIPWRERTDLLDKMFHDRDHLAFGFMDSDGVVSPHPPITRSLHRVKKALVASGHRTIPWKPPPHNESADIHAAFMNADGGADVFEQIRLSGEPFIPELRHFGEDPDPPMPLLEFFKNCLRLKNYRQRYASYWESTAEETGYGRPVDAVILPVAPHAAVIPGKWYHYDYATIANTLDYTTVVIPVTFANSKIDVFNSDYKPLNDVDRLNWEAYDPETYDGAPASIQLLGRRHEEEKLLEVAQIVVDALRLFSVDSSQKSGDQRPLQMNLKL